MRSKSVSYISLSNPSWNELYDTALKNFDESLEICKSYEQFILGQTSEMTVIEEDIAMKKLTMKYAE